MAALSNLKECPPLSTDPNLTMRQTHSPELKRYPQIRLNSELMASHTAAGQRFYGAQSFLPVDEGVLKRITRIFFDAGFWESLEEARGAKSREQAPLIARAGDLIAQIMGLVNGLKLKIFPHTQGLSAERIAQFVETGDWLNSNVRCLAWHLHIFKLAVAGLDDVVRIYTRDSSTVAAAVLKSPLQTEITCMAWRPLCSAQIVIGCRQGLCFWNVETAMHLGRTNAPSQIFRHPASLPITSLQWNKDGTQLATTSIGDRSVIIWQTDNGLMQPLKRLGPPFSLLKWSPDNEWLFAATVDRVFRVWNCHKRWTTERWVCNGGYVQTACWSPCGRFLLFVSSAEPILYRLQFVQMKLGDSCSSEKEVLPIADLNACSTGIDGNSALIGGPAQQMAWDPHGNYLVISFKSTNSIAVFRTYIQKFEIKISAAYSLSGETAAERPSFICFQPLYKENDRSVLTIAWSSGRIQYHAFD
ncbi:aladin [Drosophila kikkawai]|uniref:Aladin n=1 Tax=Drosophila kikkawai TaxID=30033 RepID=A0A6P4J4B1_DROKI|nr:aladin [Drosophila kikkawai]XP_017030212.1 aladin [Drosophila kikkawai]